MALSFSEELGFFSNAVDYKDYEVGLRTLLGKCHTQKELDTAKIKIDEVKARLMTTDPKFRSIIEAKGRDSALRAKYEQAIHHAKMSETRKDVDRIRRDALSDADRFHREALAKVPKVDVGVEDWVAKTRYKTYNPELKEKQLDAGLWCPICQKQDKRRNMVNGKPTCTECWHGLVSKDKLREYPRKYRRAWKKK